MTKQIKPHATQKDVGKYILEELGVPRFVPLLFDQSDTVFMFGRLALVKADDYGRLSDIIKRIEYDSGVKVYAVTHEFIAPIGEMYSFLCVSPYEEDWDQMFRPTSDPAVDVVYAYVQNVSDDRCSEFGYVAIKSFCGKLRRVV